MKQSHKQHMFISGEWVTLKQGRYRIVGERCLGEGGQSAVWKAERESDRKIVVVRTVNLFDIGNDRRDVRDDNEIESLLDYATAEVQFLKSMGEGEAVKHFILPVLDDGTITHPLFPSLALPTTVMPWYERGDLGQYVRSRNQRKPFDAADLLRWSRQLATALLYIHQQHGENEVSVHRDVKPKNIVLNHDGDAALTDFGIVRAAASLGTSSVVGSFLYCAPEQVLATHRSEKRHKQYLITPAVDIYSFAITLHELLAGQTEAQKRLALKTNTQNTVDEHDSFLPPSGQTRKGKFGYLGTIGGLTTKEKSYLHSQILTLFSPVAGNQTIVVGNKQQALPDAGFIADGMTDLLERMLAPWHTDRPTAAEVLTVFTVLEQSFAPVLDGLNVSLLQERISVGQSCTLQVGITGVGLPADCRWLRFECNGQLLKDLQPVWRGTSAQGLLSIGGEDTSSFAEVVVPLPPETGEYRLKVSATVAGKVYSQQVVCHITLTAAQLWGLERHEDALRLELNQIWLDALLQQATDLKKRIQLHDLLQRLKTHYVDNEDAQIRLVAMLKLVNELVPPPPSKLKWLLFLLVITVAGGGYWSWVAVVPPSATKPAHKPATDSIMLNHAVKLELVNIPAGTFTMGCEDGRDNVAGVDKCEEKSAHQVSVKAFQIGTTEVTFDQWDACKICHQIKDRKERHGNHPVSGVNWEDVQTYLKWLRKVTNDDTYRLPTEAEWEFAARAGKNNAYTWGQQIPICKDASYDRNCNTNTTSPVVSYQANAWGLFNTCGNVWEWVADCWHSNYKGHPDDGSAWLENCENASLGVLRGGSYVLAADKIRIASREKYPKDNGKDSRRFTNGFRIAKGVLP